MMQTFTKNALINTRNQDDSSEITNDFILKVQKLSLENNQLFESKDFNIDTFKTELCINQDSKHNKKHCFFYHNENDRRRNPTLHDYKCDFCMYGRNCSKGDGCEFSHNKVEQLYHSNRYKTKYCQSTADQCVYGAFCTFAHGDQEINIPIKLHLLSRNVDFWINLYKTVWCPCIDEHDRASCVYAHNAQDFRRDPEEFHYKPQDCPHWNKSQSVTNYEQGGCNDMHNCLLCHGWKELEYHPLSFRTKRCSHGVGCLKRNNDCAYFHDNDKRVKPIIKTGQIQPSIKQALDNLICHQVKTTNTRLHNFDFPNKKIPMKGESNYNGPIIPDVSIAHLQQSRNLDKKKLNVGQPFEVFSTNSLTQTSTGSRKNSDTSQEIKTETPQMTNRFPKRFEMPTQSIQSPKKNRTAPSTPEQNLIQPLKAMKGDIQNFPFFIQPKIPYSSQFQTLLNKYSKIEIASILLFNGIIESNLLQMNQFELNAIQNLNENQIKILKIVIQEMNLENDYFQQQLFNGFWKKKRQRF